MPQTRRYANGYPILLRLDGQLCLVVGGGNVATRKVAELLEANAQVKVVSPALAPLLQDLASEEQIRVHLQRFVPSMLDEERPFLVFAATDSPEVNQQVVEEARRRRLLVGAVDNTVQGNFTSMASFQQGALTIAVSTNGTSPTLAIHLRQLLETQIGPEYGTLSNWLGEFRGVIQQQIASEEDRRQLWQAIIASPVLDLLRRGDEEPAYASLRDLVSCALEKADTQQKRDLGH